MTREYKDNDVVGEKSDDEMWFRDVHFSDLDPEVQERLNVAAIKEAAAPYVEDFVKMTIENLKGRIADLEAALEAAEDAIEKGAIDPDLYDAWLHAREKTR